MTTTKTIKTKKKKRTTKGASPKTKAAAAGARKGNSAKYVIIGNSAAGVGCVEGIRNHDSDGKIIIISDEPYFTYSRPLISYYLAGKVDESKMDYRPRDFYEAKKVEPLLGARVASVDPEDRVVHLEGREEIAFESLLIATGGTPFVPPVEGATPGTFYTFTKWDDAKSLLEVVRNVESAVVVGGGLIGLKATEGLLAHKVKVTVVELADTILSIALNQPASEMMQKALEEAGAKVITGNTVAEIKSTGGKVTGVALRDGRSIDCQLVVIAIGVVPNVEIVKGTDIEIDRGIIVDDKLETNVKGVYAAGDVAQSTEILLQQKRVIPIWPHAYRQGRIAGENMAGGETVYTGGFPMNSIEINRVPVISMGMSNVEGDTFEILERKNPFNNSYRRIVLRNDTIVGALMVNAIDRAGIVTGLIRDKINVKNFKENLLDDKFGYISLPKKLRRDRLEKVGVKQ